MCLRRFWVLHCISGAQTGHALAVGLGAAAEFVVRCEQGSEANMSKQWSTAKGFQGELKLTAAADTSDESDALDATCQFSIISGLFVLKSQKSGVNSAFSCLKS